MDGFLTHHPGKLSLGAQHDDPLAHQDLRVPASDFVEEEEALLVNVCNLKPDFIDVSGQHDTGFSLEVDACYGVPRNVRPNLICESFRLFPPYPGWAGLETGGARTIQ
jgi:hypothetical protein